MARRAAEDRGLANRSTAALAAPGPTRHPDGLGDDPPAERFGPEVGAETLSGARELLDWASAPLA